MNLLNELFDQSAIGFMADRDAPDEGAEFLLDLGEGFSNAHGWQDIVHHQPIVAAESESFRGRTRGGK